MSAANILVKWKSIYTIWLLPTNPYSDNSRILLAKCFQDIHIFLRYSNDPNRPKVLEQPGICATCATSGSWQGHNWYNLKILKLSYYRYNFGYLVVSGHVMAIYLKWYMCPCHEPLVAHISIHSNNFVRVELFLDTVFPPPVKFHF